MVCARGAACQPRRCQVSYKSPASTTRRRFSDPHRVRRFSASSGVNPTVRLQAMGTETATGVWTADPRCLAGRVAPWCPASPTEADWTPESGRPDQAGEEEFPSDSVPLSPPLPCFFCCSRSLHGSFSLVISASSPLLAWGSARPVVPDPHPCFECGPVGHPQAPGPFAISMQQRRTPPPRPPLRSNPKCEDKLFSCRT